MAGGVAQDPIGAEPRPGWLLRLTTSGAGDAVSRRPPLLVFAASAFVLFWLIVAAFPFAWTVWGSFKIQADFFSRDSWWNAILGTNTTRVTGDPFTGAAGHPAGRPVPLPEAR